jgi:hypothetical protein
VTEEIEGNDELEDASDGRPRYPLDAMQTAEIDVSRDRRATLLSPIPAILAESMLSPRAAAPRAGDPAAPQAERPERTRRIGESDRQAARPGGASPLGDTSAAARRQRAAQRIDEARAALDAGELTVAVAAAEAAMVEADDAPAPGIAEVIEPARPLLTRVFATFVGPPGGVPVLAPRAQEIARARLGDAERALLGRIDGTRTLDELFDGSGFGSTNALRIAARLIRSGAIRVV